MISDQAEGLDFPLKCQVTWTEYGPAVGLHLTSMEKDTSAGHHPSPRSGKSWG
jgi:hypothetical protein